MKIISKAQAMKLLGQIPNARVTPFNKGRYEWTGHSRNYCGKDVPDVTGVLAVFPERRQDNWGPYAVLRSISATHQPF